MSEGQCAFSTSEGGELLFLLTCFSIIIMGLFHLISLRIQRLSDRLSTLEDCVYGLRDSVRLQYYD